MPSFWLTLAAVARAEGNVNEERQANMEEWAMSSLQEQIAQLRSAISAQEALRSQRLNG
jgi:hypothetical protein